MTDIDRERIKLIAASMRHAVASLEAAMREFEKLTDDAKTLGRVPKPDEVVTQVLGKPSPLTAETKEGGK